MGDGRDQIGEALDQPIPDVIEPIVGYRYWQWSERGLTSARGTFWKPGEALEAECKPSVGLLFSSTSSVTGCGVSPSAPFKPEPVAEPESPPDEVEGSSLDLIWDRYYASRKFGTNRDPIHGEYGCGIYAYSTVEEAWKNIHHLDSSSHVVGEVELWGNVWPHEHGYRGQFARVRALYRPVKGALATIWGDPFDALAKFYGVEARDLPIEAEERGKIEEAAKEEGVGQFGRMNGLTNLISSGLYSRRNFAAYNLTLPLLSPETDAQKAEREQRAAEYAKEQKKIRNRIKKRWVNARNWYVVNVREEPVEPVVLTLAGATCVMFGAAVMF